MMLDSLRSTFRKENNTGKDSLLHPLKQCRHLNQPFPPNDF